MRLTRRGARPRRARSSPRQRWRRRPGVKRRAAASPAPAERSPPTGKAVTVGAWACRSTRGDRSDGMCDAPQEILGSLVLWRAQHLARHALFDDLAAVDEDGPIGHLASEAHLVGDDDR